MKRINSSKQDIIYVLSDWSPPQVSFCLSVSWGIILPLWAPWSIFRYWFFPPLWTPVNQTFRVWKVRRDLRWWRRERSRERAASPSSCRKSDSWWQRCQCEAAGVCFHPQKDSFIHLHTGGRREGTLPSFPGSCSRSRAPLCGHSVLKPAQQGAQRTCSSCWF